METATETREQRAGYLTGLLEMQLIEQADEPDLDIVQSYRDRVEGILLAADILGLLGLLRGTPVYAEAVAFSGFVDTMEG